MTTTLEAYLAGWGTVSADRRATAKTITAIAHGAMELTALIARGRLAGDGAAAVGTNSDGDTQKALDVTADTLFRERLSDAGVASMVSEEAEHAIALDHKGDVCVAIDPLDGSSNIDANAPVGTIFSIVAGGGRSDTPTSPFLERGSAQKAAGYVIYGQQTALALTVGKGTNIFTLDPETKSFLLTHPAVRIPEATNEYAINGSNERHWSMPIRDYVVECRAGTAGSRNKDFNTRWNASLVAEAHRILVRGGVFLYPADARKGYERGRLRLLYEANPIAFLIEQAGGKAFDGFTRILDLTPTKIHERTPLIFGSVEEVDIVARYKSGEQPSSRPSPLLRNRSLHTH